MIKDLIADITYKKISLSDALTRAKLIAYKIKSDDFKLWLKNELEGYEDKSNLPSYRIIDCHMFIKYRLPDGRVDSKPVRVSEEAETDFYNYVNFIDFYESIAVIEEQVCLLKEVGYIQLTAEQAFDVATGDQFQKWVVGGHRKFGKGQIQSIIVQTQQKLLDTLLELDSQFPNLDNDFKHTEVNEKTIHNIVNATINSNGGSVNIATGENIRQHIAQDNSQHIFSELERLGVDKPAIEELKEIVKNSEGDKSSRKEKVLKWFGSVSASVVAKGFAEGIPKMIELIQGL